MARVIIYRERGENRQLEKVGEATVVDTAPDKETAGWTAWSRTRVVPPGNYVAALAGKRFSATEKSQTITSPLGAQ
jgi:hypothetical protein